MTKGTPTIAVAVLAWLASPEFGGQAEPGGRPPTLTYNITDLGTLGGGSSVALGVNNKGQVVGSADIPGGLRHAYLWENGEMIDLGTLGYPSPAQSEASDINNQGVVVGIVGGGDPAKAFIWENGVQTELGNPQVLKSAFGINDGKQVVGIFVVPAGGGDRHAFLWENGTMTDLGTLGGTYSIAWDINQSGQVVGKAFTMSAERAFLWENGVMSDLGTLGGPNSVAFGINDVGQVVGSAAPPEGLLTAFIWDNGIMTDLGAILGTPGSSAEAINNHGEVVGFGYGPGVSFRGFIYDPQLGMNLLEDMIPSNSGWSDLVPRDINDNGWIVGAGTGPAGRRAFLMTPAIVIPTVSEYGSVVTALLILTCGTILILRTKAPRGRPATLHQKGETNGVPDECESPSAPVGACCTGTTCTVTQQSCCTAQGGSFKGGNVTCDDCNGNGVPDACQAGLRACCPQWTPFVECVLWTEECCSAVGGEYYPTQKTCDAVFCGSIAPTPEP